MRNISTLSTVLMRACGTILPGIAGCGVANADQLQAISRNNAYYIRFSEPVVPESVCDNQFSKAAGAADKGLDLFDITGDDEHRPEAVWRDQNRLHITFPRGASCKTEYRLSFRPGCDKYLSGKPMAVASFTFRCQPTPLAAMRVPGLREGSVLVFPSATNAAPTKEALEFGTNCGVSYTYRRVIEKWTSRGNWEVKYGESVPAVVGPAQLKHGIHRDALLRWTEQKADWAGLSPESTLPNTVLVQPERPLPAGTTWELTCTSSQEQGFASGKIIMQDIEKDLRTFSRASYETGKDAKPGDPPTLTLSIGISAPVTKEEAHRVFRETEISVGGAKAVQSADSDTKTLTIDGKEYRFSLAGLLPAGITEFRHPHRSGQEELPAPRSYEQPGVCEGFDIKVEGQTPIVVDLKLPKGITTSLGWQSKKEQTHRLTLNPAWPSIDNPFSPAAYAFNGGRKLPLLPLKGEHKMTVTLDNQATLTATAFRIPAHTFVENAELIHQAVRPSGRGENIVKLKRRLMRHGLGVEKLGKRELADIQKALADELQESKDPAATMLMSRLNAGKTQQIAVPAPADTNCGTSEAVLDLDSLCGGKVEPGIYLIKLSSCALPSVRAVLADLKLADDTLDLDRYVLVQVSDLRFTAHNFRFLLTRISDGKPVQQAKVSVYEKRNWRDKYRLNDTVEIHEGYGSWQSKGESDSILYLVEEGSDYALYEEIDDDSPSAVEARVVLQTDRQLYRPGEQVHVRGIFRMKNELEGRASKPEEGMPVGFSVRKPDGKELLNRTVTLDSVGALDETFTLPEGEEDVTGTFRIRVSSADGEYQEGTNVECQVFRRDSFAVESKLDAEEIRPSEFTLHISAQDYNGTPVAKGKAKLRFDSPVSLLQFGDKTYPAPEPAGTEGGAKASMSEEELEEALTQPQSSGVRSDDYELVLDAEGKAEIKGKFAGFQPEDGGMLTISGSVANDREEYVQITPATAKLYAADFSIDYNSGVRLIYLTDNTSEAKNTLEREQALHITLLCTAVEESTLPNGFTFTKEKPGTVLMEKDVTVPAGCRDGFPLDASAIWKEFRKKNPGAKDPRFVISGSDPQGRCTQITHRLYAWYNDSDSKEETVVTDGKCSVENGEFKLQTPFLQSGTACILVNNGFGRNRFFQREVEAGKQCLTLPVGNEEGPVQIDILLMHPDARGNYIRCEHHLMSAEIPCNTYKLATELQLPDKPLRPGAALHVQGQVKDKDGKGAPSVITLFAVDKGMLSVSPFRVQDLTRFFTARSEGEPFSGRFLYSPMERATEARRNFWMIPGIWVGKDFGPHRSYGFGMESNGVMYKSASLGRSMAGMGRMHACKKAPSLCMEADADECMDDDSDACEAPAPQAAPCVVVAQGEDECGQMLADVDAAWQEDKPAPAKPRLRTDFQPVAFWLGALRTDAEGKFSADIATLPDTLTTYKVYALVLGESGTHFGNAEGELTVNQPLMLTPGAPLFMSTGDVLRLPLNVANNTEQEGMWEVTLDGDTQQIRLGGKGIGTLYFDYTATDEGEAVLDWTAMGKGEGAENDAVQAKFPVRYPAPLLKEAHHLVLDSGKSQKAAAMLAPELAGSTRGQMEIQLSANPLLHLMDCMDFVLSYPYGCTEQTSSGLLPWLFYKRLAPVSPLMAETPAAEVHKVISTSLEKLFKRQQKDGGLSYWDDGGESCAWASAYAGLVFTIAKEEGVEIPRDKMDALRGYLRDQLGKMRKKNKDFPYGENPMTLFSIARCLGDNALLNQALETALANEKEGAACPWRFFWHKDTRADLRLIRDLRREPAKKHDFFLQWMRTRGHDYRHTTTWRSGWMLIALHEYLRLTPDSSAEATVALQDGTSLTLNQGVTILKPQGKPLSAIPTEMTTTAGVAYAVVKVKAQPDQIEYPGVTEKGLQITRIYEKKGADGIWREATEFAVGDVVRVTLTCAKAEDMLEYFVLEDYLPSCMEAINPNVPSQAAGLDFPQWSTFFDHKEYLADRVRGFCTLWYGRDLLNMSYYARVKRAGTATAPPAQAQLMYEPQTYGLSPNRKIQSK